MERYKIGLPKEENIIVRDRFIVDIIMPLCIRCIDRYQYTILFVATQQCTEENVYIQMMFNASDPEEVRFFDNHSLNLNNIQKNPNRLNFYIEMTKDMQQSHIYACDFNMIEYPEKKIYYVTYGGIVLDEKGNIGLLDFLITRDNYIKLNLFFNRLANHDITAESVFTNKKLSNIEYIKIDHVKLDASATDSMSNIVCNHYTCGRGPTIFKFNYITKKIPGRALRNPLLPELYNTFYSESFVVTDMIYDTEKENLIVLCEERSEINDIYKSTKALVFKKEMYDKTNLIDPYNIYQKETKTDEESIK